MIRKDAVLVLSATIAAAFAFETLDIPDDNIKNTVRGICLFLKIYAITRLFGLFEIGIALLKRILSVCLIFSMLELIVLWVYQSDGKYGDFESLVALLVWYSAASYLSMNTSKLPSAKEKSPLFFKLIYFVIAYLTIDTLNSGFYLSNTFSRGMSITLGDLHHCFAIPYFAFAIFTLYRIYGDNFRAVKWVWLGCGIPLLILYTLASIKNEEMVQEILKSHTKSEAHAIGNIVVSVTSKPQWAPSDTCQRRKTI